MIHVTFQHIERIASERKVAVYKVIDEMINQQISFGLGKAGMGVKWFTHPATTHKIIPLQKNRMIQEFEFNHEGRHLFCEADYSVDINPNNDRCEVIGEIKDVFTDEVVELKEKTIRNIMHDKFWQELEAIREDLRAEKTSPLRDFGARAF